MTKNNKDSPDPPLSRVDIWAPAAVGIVGLALLVVLAERNPDPSPFQLKIYTSILALSAAAFAAVVPGLLQIRFSAAGIVIRAVGAIAVFALVLWFEPAQTRLTEIIGVDLEKPETDTPPPAKQKPASVDSTAREPSKPEVATTPPAQVPSFTGRWIGNVRDRTRSYRMAVDIGEMRAGEMVALVDYPGLCSGRWRLDSLTERTAQFRELIEDRSCITNVVVEMKLEGRDDATLTWSGHPITASITRVSRSAQ